jgi:hypothetical protein
VVCYPAGMDRHVLWANEDLTQKASFNFMVILTFIDREDKDNL